MNKISQRNWTVAISRGTGNRRNLINLVTSFTMTCDRNVGYQQHSGKYRSAQGVGTKYCYIFVPVWSMPLCTFRILLTYNSHILPLVMYYRINNICKQVLQDVTYKVCSLDIGTQTSDFPEYMWPKQGLYLVFRLNIYFVYFAKYI